MRWTRLACITVAVQAARARRSHRTRSSSSTAARPSTSIIGSARRRRLRHLCAARSAATWASTFPAIRRSCRRTCRAPAATRRPATCYSVAPKDGTAIGALFPGGVLAPLLADTPIQHDPTKFIFVGSANQRRLHLRRARRLADQDVQGHVHAGGDRRRQQRRRHHARHADAVEQRARHEIPHRHRLCRHARDRARGRAQARCTACAASATPACSRCTPHG